MEFNFDSIQFFSTFDSGNLANVVKVLPSLVKTEEESWDLEFNVWTNPDACGTTFENLNRTWFYFGVSGVAYNHCLKINILNLNKQSKLYSQGYAPLYKTVPSARESWERIKERITYDQNNSEFALSFIHTFTTSNSTTYFAFAYPWSYTECQDKLDKLDEKFEYCNNIDQISHPQKIYYYRELLCYSNDGNRVDLITVSDHYVATNTVESRFDDKLFPDKSKPRCRDFPAKKVFFVSSRVHPGETPSSHVFNGFLDFILRENDPRADKLRRKYVFKLIPMLNPDGVVRGHYRTDVRGVNLNRVYLDPTYDFYPSIYAAKSLMVYYHCRHIPGLWQSISRDFVKTKDKSMNKRDPMQNFLDLIESSSEVMRNNLQDALSSPSDALSSRTLQDSSHQTSDTTRTQDTSQTSDTSKRTQDNHQTNDTNKRPLSFFVPLTDSVSSEITTPHLSDSRLLEVQESGVAFYIDLHAHASKKGCFFYGNQFNDPDKQIECLTYAKLVSFNSGHFDFGNCNFTEKNMYAPDKRENSTKAGSGRVAIYKHLGLIHSYTLECNYNTGRIINHIPLATGDKGRASPPVPFGTLPQKYTIAHFEEVGRALAVAALDMTDSNPWSRIIQSEFINCQGVREFLKRTHPMMRWQGSKASTSTSLQQLASTNASPFPVKLSISSKSSTKSSTSAPPSNSSRATNQKPMKGSSSLHKGSDSKPGTSGSYHSQAGKTRPSKHASNNKN